MQVSHAVNSVAVHSSAAVSCCCCVGDLLDCRGCQIPGLDCIQNKEKCNEAQRMQEHVHAGHNTRDNVAVYQVEEQQVARGALNRLSWSVSHHAAYDGEYGIIVLKKRIRLLFGPTQHMHATTSRNRSCITVKWL
jgi:hypothetical protein